MTERRAGPEAMQKVFPDIFAWRDRAPNKEAIFFENARRPPVPVGAILVPDAAVLSHREGSGVNNARLTFFILLLQCFIVP